MKKKIKASRAHIFYSGRVQGVGFRYTAEKLALDQGLTGWVRNLPDGSVEVLCEGPEKNLKYFFNALEESPLARHIKNKNVTWGAATGEFSDFTVEFL